MGNRGEETIGGTVTPVTRRGPLSRILARRVRPASGVTPSDAPPPPAQPCQGSPTRPAAAAATAPLPSAHPAPPASARLFFEAENARLCLPSEAHHWTYERAPTWYYTCEHPVPPHRLAVAPWCRERCPRGCAGRDLRLVEAEDKNGRKLLRCECAVCGAFVKFMGPPPGNVDLVWRAV
jgi:hypothetical protein